MVRQDFVILQGNLTLEMENDISDIANLFKSGTGSGSVSTDDRFEILPAITVRKDRPVVIESHGLQGCWNISDRTIQFLEALLRNLKKLLFSEGHSN